MLSLFQEQYSGSAFSGIDPNKIDLMEFPKVSRVPWTYTTLRPGDCIYIPAGRNITKSLTELHI